MGGIKFTDAKISRSISEELKKRNRKTQTLWAAVCAEHVLINFETRSAKDKRPRKAIEAGRAWARGEIKMSEARAAAFAAHAAARDVEHPAARAAARAAGHAAATAHVAAHAVHAAGYAAKSAAYVDGPLDPGLRAFREQSWQMEQLLHLGGGPQ